MLPIILVAIAAAAIAGPGHAQAATDAAPSADTTYRREVFQYSRAGRVDPFRSLLGSADLGVRIQDLSLRGVIYNPEGGRSVAMLWDEANKRQIRGRIGDRIAGITIVAISPRRVDMLIEEFGVSRRESLQLQATPKTGNGS